MGEVGPLERVGRLIFAIEDIDAHATPFGLADENDPEGNPRFYMVSVGALHRALGVIGHSAPRCKECPHPHGVGGDTNGW